MHSLAYQQGNKFSPTAMIYQNRREPDSRALNIDGIRAAVRAGQLIAAAVNLSQR
jgi:hypothetical protein